MNQKSSAPGWLLLLAVILTVLGAIQANNNDDQPTPPPPPDEVKGSYVVLLEQLNERTPYTAKVAEQFAMNESKGVRDLHWRVYDADQPSAAGLIGAATEIPLPVLMVVSPNTTLLGAWPLPPTLEGIDARVKEATGL